MEKLTIAKNNGVLILVGIFLILGQNVGATWDEEPELHLLQEHSLRMRRDTVVPQPTAVPSTTAPGSPTTPSPTLPDNSRTTASVPTQENKASPAPVVVTGTGLLGQNGSGIRNTDVTAKPSPQPTSTLLDDQDLAEHAFETPEKVKAEQNLTNLQYENHEFYNSTFIGNRGHFDEYWQNITKPEYEVHQKLSDSHRWATTLVPSFEFPFYGHPLKNITVATGGFIYTGDQVHHWLAATQYIAPLMANFDTRFNNDSLVKIFDDGEKFTVLWENVSLQENKTMNFTFAVTLYKNGDIVFAYKRIPIPVQEILDVNHPVRVGISDAYLTDKVMFYVRRKTIYEYHRITFANNEIKDGTLIRLVALPTCHDYSTCDSCINHKTAFNCSWCEPIKKCSSGTDRNKQDWTLRNCERSTIVNASMCPAPAAAPGNRTGSGVEWVTSVPVTDKINATVRTPSSASAAGAAAAGVSAAAAPGAASAAGGAAAAFICLTLVIALAAWIFYAFKNPHTRSGQMLIKYRPSQWNWRRGEARYTAATIHM